MAQQERLSRVVRFLDREQIESMVTGSVASIAQGEPRSTHDIDLVVLFRRSMTPYLGDELPPPEFCFSVDPVEEAFQRSSMFNLLWIDTGDKVDFWMLTQTPFDQSRFSRKVRQSTLNRDFWVSSPEDTILAKLRWSRMSAGSEKQFPDALRVFEE